VNPYESGKLLAEYLFFHYGSAERAAIRQLPIPAETRDFAVRCVHELIDAGALPPGARALDLGCSVGRSTFELARFCDEVVGLDLSHSFIKAARLLQEKGVLPFEVLAEGDISELMHATVPMEIERRRVRFEVHDATNLPSDFGRFDLLLAANLICRLRSPRRFLERLSSLVNPKGQLLLTTPFTWLEEFTPRAEWLGGRKEEGIRSSEAVKQILEPDFELQLTKDLPFMIREHERKFQYGIALGWRWVRR
jgi:putative 4-mercaptohistidine N1-methyltranferase